MQEQRRLRRQATVDPDVAKELARQWCQKQVSAHSIMNGDFLPALAEEYAAVFQQLAPDRALAPNRRLTWASACTGSGGDLLVQKAMQRAYNSRGIRGVEFATLFDCEADKKKREYHAKLRADVDPENDSCMFTEICHLGGMTAWCDVHGCFCKVPSVDCFSCCTSCKDMSRVNGQQSSLVLRERTSGGGSAQTFQGLLSYISAHPPGIIFFENVDTISDNVNGAAFNNKDVVLAELNSRGYECQEVNLDSYLLGVPQHRLRFYVLGINTRINSALTFGVRSVEVALATLRACVKVCQRRAPDARELMLPDTDAAVEAELQRRLAQPTRNHTYAVDKYQAAYAQKGLRWGDGPPRELGASLWWPTLTAEQRDSLIFSLAMDDKPVLMRDVLWSIGKVRQSTICPDGRHVSFTVIPKQVVMLFPSNGTPRLQLGREAMLLHGFPLPTPGSQLATVSESMWHDLAGNMVSLPCCLALMMAAFIAVDWRQEPSAGAACAGEVAAAEAAFQLIAASGAVPDEDEDDCDKKRYKMRRV